MDGCRRTLHNVSQKAQESLTHCLLGNFSCFLSSADFFQNQLFEKFLSGIPSECQTVWTLIRPDDSSGLIWVQTVCQGYQQTTLVDKELKSMCLDFENMSKRKKYSLLTLSNRYILIKKANKPLQPYFLVKSPHCLKSKYISITSSIFHRNYLNRTSEYKWTFC